MNLYLIYRDNHGLDGKWDVYRAAVVAAVDEAEARNTHPDGEISPPYTWEEHDAWVLPERVGVQYLGHAVPGTRKGVICSDYKAG